jgi:hypothetical protein
VATPDYCTVLHNSYPSIKTFTLNGKVNWDSNLLKIDTIIYNEDSAKSMGNLTQQSITQCGVLEFSIYLRNASEFSIV